MTREIKFRAWDEKRKIMGKPFTLEDMSYDFDDGYFIPGVAGVDPTRESIVMQCTGLKDKNGKEIYEGDIVKIKYYNLSFGDVYKNVEVKWVNVAGSDEMGTDMVGFVDVSGSELIGNVYENPELLKEE